MPTSQDLLQNSVQAALAAIEIYNKPNFSYREEGFSLLFVNAWELLLKAKWVTDSQGTFESLYTVKDASSGTYKLNRTGNPITHGLTFLARKYVEASESGFDVGCENNVLALVEIRDAAAHLVNTDVLLARRVLEIGTASLRNYVQLATEWFGVDFSVYNFFIMPLSFQNLPEKLESLKATSNEGLVDRLFTYLDGLEAATPSEGKPLSIKIETRLTRSKEKGAVPFRITNDPTAPAVIMREEDVLESYPFDYRAVAKACKGRYSDFSQNKRFTQLMKSLRSDKHLVHERLFDPRNPKSGIKRLYNGNIFFKLDEHYTKRRELSAQGSLVLEQTCPAAEA